MRAAATVRKLAVGRQRSRAEYLPAALPAFREILDAGINLVPEASPAISRGLAAQAHQKDVPILAAAVGAGADFLATFNVRHFRSRSSPPLIVQPRRVVAAIRASLLRLLAG